MPFMLRKSKQKLPKPSSSASALLGGRDASQSPTQDAPRRKQHKRLRLESPGSSPSSSAGLVFPPPDDGAVRSQPRKADIADMVLDPYLYTMLLLQASAARDAAQNDRDRPSTPLGSTHDLEVPHSTPSASSHVSETTKSDGGHSDALVEGVPYDAILASKVQKTLAVGMEMVSSERRQAGYGAPPVPPNSPVGMQDGVFGSLMGLSMAIMEERMLAPIME
ncbi:hypothetical protein BDZ97DRAFT_1835603 [Flammula alnicola]|nr:hypothetical protein BDZ97DRAFT_1835603 [Flammula alnicola]